MHAHHSKCPAYADLFSFPLAVFRNTMSKAVSKAVKPPAKKHLGKKLRVVSPFVTAKELVQEQFSTALGLPTEDSLAYIERDESGDLKPTKQTAASYM